MYVLYFTEKYLVHEFATLRYGVFQEYPSPGENQFYFSTTFGRLDPVRCTVGLRGIIKNAQGFCLFTSIDPDTGEFPPGCAYIPYPYRAAGTASMMDHQYVREVHVQHLLYTSRLHHIHVRVPYILRFRLLKIALSMVCFSLFELKYNVPISFYGHFGRRQYLFTFM